ncbi:lysophospholipid acyltransferase family protein [Streptomyces sp. NPDC013953]|uniref:lysophospholipid acyltransferase family protein n=1 Tax=Streptomyces sp. NPDC013953 TaxID=3364868 RepID=UPI0036FCCA97
MNPWLPASPCTPGHCARHHAPAAGRARAVARLATGVLTVLAGLLCAPLTLPLGLPARRCLTRLWCRAVIRAFGVRVRVRGAAGDGGAQLVVANHVSWLDIPLVAAVLPGRMLAKSEVRHWPVLGPLAARGGTFFLDRGRLRALPGTVRDLAAALRGGARVVVFPEGSTWCGRAGGRFRPAVFQAALDANVPVRPVRIRYEPAGPAAFVGDDPLIASLWRVAAVRDLTAEIRILPPVPAGRHTDRRSLARAAEHAVAPARVPAHVSLPPRVPSPRGTAAPGRPAHTAVASDSANRPSPSVHQCASSIPAPASSRRTPS